MKYTKGPWIKEAGSHSGHCCFEESVLGVVDGKLFSVAEIFGAYEGDSELIRAAPEMYEALLECRQALEPYNDVKPRDWKTDREKLIHAFKRVDELLKGFS